MMPEPSSWNSSRVIHLYLLSPLAESRWIHFREPQSLSLYTYIAANARRTSSIWSFRKGRPFQTRTIILVKRKHSWPQGCSSSAQTTSEAMAERKQLPLRAIALGAGACAVAGLGFVGQSSQVGHHDVVKGLRGAQSAATPTSGYGSAMLPLVGAGAVAAGVAQRASRVGRRAEKTFAGGIAGSKLHGWGEYQFDPLGLAEKFPENLAWFREAELKHGRVAMLAFVGLIVPDAIRLPIEPLTDSSLDFINAHNKLIGPGLGEGPMWWLMCAVGAIESVRFKQLGLAFEKLTTENAGDLGLRGFAPSSAEGMESMKMKELKNGRLAMLAVGGALTQGVAFGANHFPFIPQWEFQQLRVRMCHIFQRRCSFRFQSSVKRLKCPVCSCFGGPCWRTGGPLCLYIYNTSDFHADCLLRSNLKCLRAALVFLMILTCMCMWLNCRDWLFYKSKCPIDLLFRQQKGTCYVVQRVLRSSLISSLWLARQGSFTSWGLNTVYSV